ncbi:MAG: Tm-1-like ATP-binding domain-containing protein [Planctomycetaceae bacterium]
MPVYLLVTLDTKGVEAAFVRDQLKALGVETRLVDTGCLGEPTVKGDVSREELFAAAGSSLSELRAKSDRGQAVTQAALGAAEVIRRAHAAGQVAGVLGLGGSAGTTIATAAMRALPLGVPKLMVSTLASGQVRQYVGDKDILMLNAVVDILGINRISRTILGEAARAMAGLVKFAEAPASQAQPASAAAEKPLVVASMFGVTTPCVTKARELLEAAGYEVLVFHATGNGGQAMESLIADGLISGVFDLTTTELPDNLVGGVCSAGPDRLTAAGKRGVPQMISVGAVDMVNFAAPETVPEKFKSRKFYRHNPTVTLMRTTVEENRAVGEEIGRKAAAAKGPTVIILPKQGVSAIDRAGQPFDDPEARAALFAGIRTTCGKVEVVELDCHINDPQFAETAARRLLAMMPSRGAGR